MPEKKEGPQKPDEERVQIDVSNRATTTTHRRDSALCRC